MKLILSLLVTIFATSSFAESKVKSTPGVEEITSTQVNSYYFAIAENLRGKNILCQDGQSGILYRLSFLMFTSESSMEIAISPAEPNSKVVENRISVRENGHDKFTMYVDRRGSQPVIRFLSRVLISQMRPDVGFSYSSLQPEFEISTDATFKNITGITQSYSSVREVNVGTIVNPVIQRQRELNYVSACRITAPSVQ